MNARLYEPRITITVTTLIAIVVTILPLPGWLALVRPSFAVLTVLYWSVAAPRAGGLTLGFVTGLALDVFRGSVLGQHALALTAITYIAVREHQKIRSKPAFQQSLIVLGALIVYEFIVFAIDGWTGHPLASVKRWIPALTGAIIWPLVTAMLERSHSPR